jgi:glycosyltransferase involved in cell wall biosynthesis
VIVPCFDEATRIDGALDALLAQDYPAERLEVVVVDNGSQDETVARVEARIAAGSTVRLVLLQERATRGPDAARNRALKSATSEVLAFTDADCAPRRDWIARAVAALEAAPPAGAPPAALVAGRIEFPLGAAPRVAELYDAAHFLRHELSVATRGTAFTANLLVRRAVLEALGGFPVVRGSNGDAWLTRRATRAGHRLVYAADAVVAHPPRRARELLAKVRRIGLGQGVAGTAEGGGLADRPHLQSLDPRRLARRLADERLAVGVVTFWRLWAFVWLVALYGAAWLAIGRVLRTIPSRRRPPRYRSARGGAAR